MIQQIEMFRPPTPMRVETPAARASDPETSHLAAEEVTASGVRQQQIGLAIAAVRAHPDRTSMELSVVTGHDRYMLARRLPDAETAGAVRKGPARTCTVSGRKAVTWLPA